ncbi:MAG: type II secretion system protein GspG [Planctomycetota bacterium]
MARSKPILPLVLITVLAVGLVAALAAGVRYVLQEPRAVPQPEAGLPDFTNDTSQTIHRVRRSVGSEGILAMHIKRYELRLGRWPGSLDDLIRQPEDLEPGEVWDGPYIHAEALLSDPWGNRYRYQTPGLHNINGYDLWSAGPDGKDDSGDEIGNWSPGTATTTQQDRP